MQPTVTGLTNGNFIISYSIFNIQSNWDIKGQIFDQNGQRIGNEIPINTYRYKQ